MINKENILKTAQALVKQYDLPLKIRGVEELPEAVAIYFTSEKRVKLRELAQELEIQLNLPIKLERIKKEELGKIGGVDILGKYACCAPFLRKCPFGDKFGCGYGFATKKTPARQRVAAGESGGEDREPKTDTRKQKTEDRKPPKKAESKKKKVVRKLVLKS
jgi:hypothetical protein